MNGSAAVDLIMSRLGNRTQASLRSIVVSEMEIVQSDLLDRLEFKPWFLRTTDSTLVTVAESDTVTLPSNFSGFDDDWGGVWWKDTSRASYDQWTKLEKIRYADAVAAYRDDEDGLLGSPKVFDIANLTLLLRPVPDMVYSLKLDYYKLDTAPTDTTATNLWLTYAPKLLIASTAQIVAATHLQNTELAQTMQGEMETALKQLWKTHERRTHEQMSYNMGEPS